MNTFKDHAASISLMLSIPVVSVFYKILNNPGRGVNSLVTHLDREIPFIKAFIIPYLGWYVFIFYVLLYLCLTDKKTYYKTLLSYNLGLVVCYLFFFTYQTTVPRPHLAGNDLLTYLVLTLYKIDQPYNCFPSIHCLTSYLMIKAVNKCNLKTNFLFCLVTACGTLIIVSTLFVKQHTILDALAAILLADIIFKLVCYVDEENIIARLKKQYLLLTTKKRLGI
ncbi:phosphatase PAP2 family protein [Desulfotomaculum varum]